MNWRAPHEAMAFTAQTAVAVATTAADPPAESAAATARSAEQRELFEDLLTTHWRPAYRYAYRLTGNPQDAEDLLQQAAEEAYRAFDRFRPGTLFDRWLFRILHNSFVDLARRRRRRTILSIGVLPPGTLVADSSSDPVVAAEGILAEQVQQAIGALPLEYRGAVVLVDLMNLRYEEAADVLGCPVGTIRSRLHRGRLALRQSLRPYIDAKCGMPAG